MRILSSRNVIICWISIFLLPKKCHGGDWIIDSAARAVEKKSFWILPICGLGAVWGISKCVKVINSGDECLIERLGKYHRQLGPGIHWIWKPIETISFQVTTREQLLDIPPQRCYTKDNAPIKADAVVYLKIINVQQAKYNVEDVKNALMNLCLTQLREEVGKLTLDESFSSRERINFELLKDLNAVSEQWGIQITRVELQNLTPSPDIESAMELQMAAERKKRASILQSEGERITLINEAEGKATALLADAEARKKAIILEAQAEAERQNIEARGLEQAMERVAHAVEQSRRKSSHPSASSMDPMEIAIQFLSVIRYMETQAKFAGSNGTKVLMLPSKDSIPLTYGGLKFLLD